MKRIITIMMAIGITGITISSLCANEVRLSFDNDFFVHTDRYYTHGTTLAYSRYNKPYTSPILRSDVTYQRYTLGQYMYNPSDIEVVELQENDRPYAGILYVDYREYVETKNRLQTMSYLVGVVGELSGGESTQKSIHKVLGCQEPMGWDNQLNNEPILNLNYQDYWMFYHQNYASLVGYYGGAIGNAHTCANIGSIARLGWNVPRNYDFNRLEPLPRVFGKHSEYLFLACEGRAIAWNTFLDGNMFSDSHSVDKEILVGDLIAGFDVCLYNIDVMYACTWRTKEFKDQEESVVFGSVSIAYRW